MAEAYNAFDGATSFNADQPASLLDLAQKVHDDYVEKGKATAAQLEADAQAKHDELIATAKEFHDISILEAESNAASIIEEAQLAAFSTLNDANLKAASILASIDDNKLKLEASILKLQEFEATYRSQLQALVAGAQATLAVAALVVEDETLPESHSAEDEAQSEVVESHDEAPAEQEETESAQVDEDPEVQESEAETVTYHLDVNPGPAYFDDSVADDDVAEVSDTEVPEEKADEEIILVDVSEDASSEEVGSENAEDDSTEDVDYTSTEEFAPKVEHYNLEDTTEPAPSYDPTAKTASINSETVASILAASGLNDNPDTRFAPVYQDTTAPSGAVNSDPAKLIVGPTGFGKNFGTYETDAEDDKK